MADDLLDFLPLFPADDEAAILARMRAWANEGLDPLVDVDRWVDTREGSHWFVAVMPTVREAARLYDLAGTEVPASAFPVWAWADYLDDHAEVQDIVRLAATAASGTVTFTGAPATVVPSGATVGVAPVSPDDAAPEYSVTTGGTIPAAAAAPGGMSATLQAGGTLVVGTVYRYVVTALDAAGETVASAEVNATPAGANQQILVDWTDVPTATSYRVYRKTGAAGPPWNLLATVVVSAYTDTGAAAEVPTTNPPAVNTTGGKVNLPVRATEVGALGNVAPLAVTVLSTPIAGVTVSNAAALSGGTEAETDDALRERVLGAYAGQGAGNKKDYERWARAWAGVGRVTVVPLWNGPGTVKLIITDAGGNPVSAATIAGLQNDLDPTPGMAEGQAPVGAIVTVVTGVALLIDVVASVRFDAGYSLDGFGGTVALRADIEKALADYIERVEPGGEVVYERVKGAIVSVAGVHDISAVTVEGGVANVPVTSNPAQVPQLVKPVTLAVF